MLISNIRENGEPIGALPDGEMMFHHDMMHAEVPHKATMLNAIEIPSHGGNTLFASGYAAYDTLPDELREPLEGRKAFHHYNYGSVQKGDDKGTPAFSESVHPVFRTHDDTGKKAIYVNRLMTEGVIDMEQDQADGLLNALFDHSESPEFVYEHEWQIGDLLLWDNRCSMHARTDFPETERRLLLRTTVVGDAKPFKHPRMPKILTEEQIAAWHSDGCIFPISAVDPDQAQTNFDRYTALEKKIGEEPQNRFKIKAHLPFP